MKPAIVFWLAASIALLAGPVHAREIRSFSSGNWRGGVYTDDQTNRFSHCAAGMNYQSGIRMMVFVNRGFEWGLGFVNQRGSWRLTKGQSINLNVSFDGRAPWGVTARALETDFVVVPMADNSRLIESFRKSLRMQVTANDVVYHFSLDGTSRMLLDLIYCAGDQLALERGERPPSREPRPSQPPPVQSASRPPPAAPAAPAPTGDRSNREELEATRLASNLLLQAQLAGARLLPREEAPDVIRARGVAWRAAASWGAVFVDGTTGRTAQQVASDLLADDGKTCRGEYASGRSSEAVDGQLVTRAFSACRESATAFSLTYFVVPRKAGGHVIFAFAPLIADGAELAPPDREQQGAFQRAALRVVSQE